MSGAFLRSIARLPGHPATHRPALPPPVAPLNRRTSFRRSPVDPERTGFAAGRAAGRGRRTEGAFGSADLPRPGAGRPGAGTIRRTPPGARGEWGVGRFD